jgi:hypothetical protein
MASHCFGVNLKWTDQTLVTLNSSEGLDRTLSGPPAPAMTPAKAINTGRTTHAIATEQGLADRDLCRFTLIPCSLIRNDDNGIGKRVTIMCQIRFG